MAKQTADQISKMISGLTEVMNVLRSNESVVDFNLANYAYDPLCLAYGLSAKGETGFVTAIKHAHKFEELFGFAPRGFGTQLYSVGMSKLQLSVVELFTIQCVENASWFHAEITKDVWLNKAAQVVSHLQRKLDKRVGEMSTAVFEA